MTHFLYAFLFLLIIPLNTQAQTESLDCNGLFNRLIKSEPYLKDELNELKTTCESDFAQKNTGYWLCVQHQVGKGNVNFERFIISTNVCEGQNSMVFSPDIYN